MGVIVGTLRSRGPISGVFQTPQKKEGGPNRLRNTVKNNRGQGQCLSPFSISKERSPHHDPGPEVNINVSMAQRKRRERSAIRVANNAYSSGPQTDKRSLFLLVPFLEIISLQFVAREVQAPGKQANKRISAIVGVSGITPWGTLQGGPGASSALCGDNWDS